MSAKPEPLAVKVRDIPGMTGLSRTRVYELIRCGELPAFRPGGRGEYLVSCDDIKAAMNRWKEQSR
jgi:excisionase family DNA binding protein